MAEFGQYQLQGLIGTGGMGEVHRAYDTRRDRQVALKLLPAAFGQDAEYQRRFRRESYTVARLREPHVIPIHDYGEIDGQLFIDMRLVDGQGLGELLAQTGAMPADRAVALVSQVADALDAANDDGLVHRDIKPSNILVTANDFVYVVDFGIAHVIGHTGSATMTGVTLGTLDYMAPERFESKLIDRRTDVYSLACVLHECLTGIKPFPGEDLPALMYGHLFLEPPQPSEANPAVPEALDLVVARGMAKSADDRYDTAGELAAAARAALGMVENDVQAAETAPELVSSLATAGAASNGSQHSNTGAQHFAAAAEPTAVLHQTATVASVSGGGGSPGPDRNEADPTARVLVADQPAPYQPMSYQGAPHQPVPYHAAPQQPPPYQHTPHDPGPPPFSPPPGAAPAAGKSRRGLFVIIAILVLVAALVAFLITTGGFGGSSVANPEALAPVPAATGPAKPPIGNSIPKPTVGATIPVGPTPGYMEIAPNGKYAYIANREARILTVFDTTRNQVTGTIPVPQGGPQFLQFSPDGTRAYVSIFNNERTVNVVGVLDTAANTFIAMVPVGVRPFALDVTPDGKRVYVPNHDSGSISVIDTATNTVVRTINVAPNPHWVDVSADGSRLYAANHDSNVVTTIDTATDAVLGTVPVGAAPHSIVALAKQALVINANYDGNSISVIDTTKNAVVNTVPTGNHPQDITLAADGKYAYIATVDDNAIQVLDLKTFKITASVPTGRSPTSVAVGPEGRQAYVTNLNDGTVTVLNIAGTA